MIRTLIVDDSRVARRVLRRQLEGEPRIQVIDEATDAYDAREKIFRHKPDVITLDIEMPRMNGLEFLKKLMVHAPMPVVVVSSVTPAQSSLAMEALSEGAVEVIDKESASQGTALARAVVRAHGARVTRRRRAQPQRRAAAIDPASFRVDIIAIGSSTGGPRAVEDVLTHLPGSLPPIVITQHMPANFTAAFAARLDRVSPFKVQEARDRQELVPGHAYVAPGSRHLKIVRRPGRRLEARLTNDAPVNRHRPSVEVLFDSVREAVGNKSVAAILTGMGDDGAAALLRMRQAGIRTFAQDERSCVVFGMPKVAIELGGADVVAPPERIAEGIVKIATGGSARAPRAAGGRR